MADRPLNPVFAPENDRVPRSIAAQQIFCEIQARLGKPLGAGHGIAVAQDRRATGGGAHGAEIPNRGPKILPPLDRPLVQSSVIGDLYVPAVRRFGHKAADVGGGCLQRIQLPHRRLGHINLLGAIY